MRNKVMDDGLIEILNEFQVMVALFGTLLVHPYQFDHMSRKLTTDPLSLSAFCHLEVTVSWPGHLVIVDMKALHKNLAI